MKKLLTTVQIIAISICLNGQTKIVGNFQSMEEWSNEIYLLAITDYDDVFSSTNKYNIDTALVDDNGSFEFKLDKTPCSDCLYRIDVRPKESNGPFIYGGTSKENFALFEIQENQTLMINGDASQLTKTFFLNKELENWSYEQIRKIREPVYVIADDMSNNFTNPEYLKGKNIDSLQEASLKKLTEYILTNNVKLSEFIEASSNIYDKIIGGIAYDFDGKMDNDIALYEKISSQLKDSYSTHPYYIQLNKNIYDTKYILPSGSVAPSLNLLDTKGEHVKLEEVGNNLILIDFWASWCSPCRHENRVTVKPLYEKYKAKGFMVYSVSMDNNKDKWLKAIEKDEMDWINVSDLQGANSPVYSIYKIDGLPTTYLVEKDGFKIVAKNIRGDELKKFIENYYKE